MKCIFFYDSPSSWFIWLNFPSLRWISSSSVQLSWIHIAEIHDVFSNLRGAFSQLRVPSWDTVNRGLDNRRLRNVGWTSTAGHHQSSHSSLCIHEASSRKATRTTFPIPRPTTENPQSRLRPPFRSVQDTLVPSASPREGNASGCYPQRQPTGLWRGFACAIL